MVSTPLRRRVKRDLLLAAVVSGSALGIVFACLYPYAACVACVAAVAGRRSLRHASRRRLAALCAAVGASFLLYVLYLRLLAPGPAAPVVDRPETLEAFRVRRRAEADPMPVLGRMLLATVAVVVAVALVPLALPWLREVLPGFGLVSEDTYRANMEATTDAELDRLREHLRRGSGPVGNVSAYAADRLGALADGFSGLLRRDATAWVRHALHPEARLATDGFTIGPDGERVDADSGSELEDGSDSDPERES